MVFAKGNTLKFARIRAGLLQAELADKAGLSANTYALIEQGRRSTTGKTAHAICQAIGQDFDQLFIIREED